MKKARGVVTELPRSTRLGPGTGMWHQVSAGQEKLRVHRRSFFKDMQIADSEQPPPDPAALTAGRGPLDRNPSAAAGHGRGARRRPAPPASPQPASVSSRLCTGRTGWSPASGGPALAGWSGQSSRPSYHRPRRPRVHRPGAGRR